MHVLLIDETWPFCCYYGNSPSAKSLCSITLENWNAAAICEGLDPTYDINAYIYALDIPSIVS